MTDVYFGDLSIIPGEMLNEINRVCEKNIVRVPMQPGDVLLCDNYRVLHGRDVFQGDRLHGAPPPVQAARWCGLDWNARGREARRGAPSQRSSRHAPHAKQHAKRPTDVTSLLAANISPTDSAAAPAASRSRQLVWGGRRAQGRACERRPPERVHQQVRGRRLRRCADAGALGERRRSTWSVFFSRDAPNFAHGLRLCGGAVILRWRWPRRLACRDAMRGVERRVRGYSEIGRWHTALLTA